MTTGTSRIKMHHDLNDLAEIMGRTDMVLELMNINQHVFALMRDLNPDFHAAFVDKNDYELLRSIKSADDLTHKLLGDEKFFMGYKMAVATAIDFCLTFIEGARFKNYIIVKDYKDIPLFNAEVKRVTAEARQIRNDVIKTQAWHEIDDIFEKFRDRVNRPICVWFNDALDATLKKG